MSEKQPFPEYPELLWFEKVGKSDRREGMIFDKRTGTWRPEQDVITDNIAYDAGKGEFVYMHESGPLPEPPAARKNDAQKDPWQLLPWDALRGIAKVLAFGARKYDARNWEQGMEWDRVWRAAIEHLTEWFQHGKPDPETGYSHLWHAGCCVLFLIAYELRGRGVDNRPIDPSATSPKA